MSDYLDTLADELSELFRENVTVKDTTHRDTGDTSVTVATVSYRVSSSSDAPDRRYVQTAVILKDKELNLPEFHLYPRIGGVFGGVMNAVGMVADMRFPDSPNFNKSYSLRSWAEKATRLLFSPELRAFFEQNPGWTVRRKDKLLIVFRQNQECPAEETEDFVRQALQILSLIQVAEEELDEQPDLHRDVRPEDMMDSLAQTGGIAGRLMQNRLQDQLQKFAITREELDEFAIAEPPRTIPRGMHRQVVGENLPLVFLGIIFMLSGAIGGTLAVVFSKGNERFIGLSFLLFFPLIGFLMTFLTLRHRKRKDRTLQQGKLVNGTITEVRRTSTKVNGELRFRVSINCQLDDENHTLKLNAYGSSVDRARRLRENGDPARVLIDPQDPTHTVCIDLLTIFE